MSMLLLLNISLTFYSLWDMSSSAISLTKITLFFLNFIVGFGVFIVFIIDIFYGYKMPITELPQVEILYLTSVLFFMITVFLFNRIVNSKKKLKNHNFRLVSDIRFPLFSLALLSIICVLLYVLVAGISFGKSSYELRYTNARGVGFLLVFFPAFIPYFIFELERCMKDRLDFKRFFLVSVVGLSYSGLLFVVLGGYRQILMGVSMLIGFYLLKYKVIAFKSMFIAIFTIFPALLVFLSFLRYGGETTVFYSPLEASLYYIQGDLFPVDAILKTIFFLETYASPGSEVFFDHFLRLVPRYFYPDKPLILNNTAGFYTQEIIQYSRGVTLSPTLVTEGLLINGLVGVILISVFTALFCCSYDFILIRTNDAILYCCLVSFVFMGFFIIREGLESGVYRFIVMLVFYYIL